MPVRGPITRVVASSCIARLLVLAAEDERAPILAYIDSPAGLASEALRILSSVNGLQCPLATFSRGVLGGAAVALAAHGVHGFRVCSPNARFLFRFDPEDARRKHTDNSLQLMAESLARDTRQPPDRVLEWFNGQVQFGASEAVANGLVDSISSKPLLPPPRAP